MPLLRFVTGGESHGPALTAILEGLPAGLKIDLETINNRLALRQGGYGRGGRQKIERDQVRFKGGVRGGLTLGGPIVVEIENRDWPNWRQFMDPGPEADLVKRRVFNPRPGHADLAGAMKFGQDDLRNILERSSARETAARVALGAVAEIFLNRLGIELAAHVVQIGPVKLDRQVDFASALSAETSAVYCVDPAVSRAMVEAIDAAGQQGDTLGGVFEVQAVGLPPGLGSFTQWDGRLDGRLAQALLSIPAVKGAEIGLGFAAGGLRGSETADAIYYAPERGFYRQTNRAGGLEGGMTNGEPLVVRAVMKPIPTLKKPLPSVDLKTKEAVEAAYERSDVCAVPAAARVGLAMTALVLAGAVLDKFGGDRMVEIEARLKDYHSYLSTF